MLTANQNSFSSQNGALQRWKNVVKAKSGLLKFEMAQVHKCPVGWKASKLLHYRVAIPYEMQTTSHP